MAISKGDDSAQPQLPGNDLSLEELSRYTAEDLEFRVVTENDGWLKAAYELLVVHFDVDVLDPFERYVDWLEQNKLGTNKFPYLAVAAYLPVDEQLIMVGVISGNIMRIEEYAGKNPPSQKPSYIFAIGHQVTSEELRLAGFKGVGTKLWNFASERAREWINKLDGSFQYSFLEAETASVGFWSKLGYLWPKDVDYWQPPLEFDEHGDYLHPEVPEILLLKPIEATDTHAISSMLLKNLIATVYYNWALDKYKTSLAPQAFKKAEDYVIGEVFGRLSKKIYGNGSINLVSYSRKDG